MCFIFPFFNWMLELIDYRVYITYMHFHELTIAPLRHPIGASRMVFISPFIDFVCSVSVFDFVSHLIELCRAVDLMCFFLLSFENEIACHHECESFRENDMNTNEYWN